MSLKKSGIGRATAIEFAKAASKINIIVTARRLDALEALKTEIETAHKGAKVLPIQLDISKPEEVRALPSRLEGKWKEVDGMPFY